MQDSKVVAFITAVPSHCCLAALLGACQKGPDDATLTTNVKSQCRRRVRPWPPWSMSRPRRGS